MRSPRVAKVFRTLPVVIAFQLGLCILLLGDLAKTTMGDTSQFVLVLQLGGGATAIGALIILTGLGPALTGQR